MRASVTSRYGPAGGARPASPSTFMRTHVAPRGARSQLREFLRFFAGKRELYVSEVEAVFADVKEAR